MNRNITLLSLVNLFLRIFIQGMFIVYPIIIQNTGVSSSAIGYFLSAMFIASLFGSWISGKLTPAIFHPKTLLLITILPITIFLCLFGQYSTYYGLLLCSLGISFFSGININTSAILIGYFSNQETIAKNFGWLGISNIVSTLIGSLIIGTSLDLFGNKLSFIIFALIYFLSNIFFVWIDKPIIQISIVIKTHFIISKRLISLLTASLIIIMLIHLFKMSLSLELKKAGYSIKQISYLSALGTFIALPFPYILGYLEKYFSPKKLLTFCYIITSTAFVILYLTANYYWVALAISFISILAYGSFTQVMSILYSWNTKESLPKAQTYYGNIAWLAAIIGYPLTGLLLEKTDFNITILIGFSMGLLATIILQFGFYDSTTRQERGN